MDPRKLTPALLTRRVSAPWRRLSERGREVSTHVAAVAVAVVLFVRIHAVSERIEVAWGEGYDGRSYADMVTGGQTASTARH